MLAEGTRKCNRCMMLCEWKGAANELLSAAQAAGIRTIAMCAILTLYAFGWQLDRRTLVINAGSIHAQTFSMVCMHFANCIASACICYIILGIAFT